MAILYQFGTYDYDDHGITVLSAPNQVGARLRVADTPGRDGGYSQGGLLAPRRLSLSGILQPSDLNDLDTEWDSFLQAHAPGQILPLYVGKDDRYLLAEVESVQDVDAENVVDAIPFEVGFYCADPYWYADTVTDVTLPDDSHVVAVSTGTARALPLFTFGLTTSGGGTFEVENGDTGESLVLTVGASGTYTIDSRTETVLKDGVRLTEGYTGVFPTLRIGNNTINYLVDDVTVGVASLSYRARWY